MGTPSIWQIVCPDSNPENIWIAEKRNWAGKVFNLSRGFWEHLSDRYCGELQNPGIYVLVGGNDGRNIYIGQSENLFKRVGEHLQDSKKSFFNKVICVTGSDLNSAHFKWMEAHLIQQAKEANYYDVENKSMPEKPRLAEWDSYTASEFIEGVKQIFSITGMSGFSTGNQIKSSQPSPKFLLDSSQEKPKERTNKRMPRSRKVEIQDAILNAFQENKNVILRKQSGGRFCDESKKINVLVSVSRYYAENSGHDYWYTINSDQIKFLQEASSGYVIFGMEGQTEAIAIEIEEFNNIRDKLNVGTQNNLLRWHVYIKNVNETFVQKLIDGEMRDLSPYILNHYCPNV